MTPSETQTMDYSITFDPAVPYVRLKAWGTITPAAFERMFRELVAHPQWRPGLFILSDYSGIEAANLSAEDIRAMAGFYATIAGRIGPGRSAIVAGGSLEYGLGRMWVSWTEMKVSRQVRIFLSSDEARAWIEEPGAESGPPMP